MSDIVIYTVDYCPYCKKAEALLNDLGIQYRKIDITFNEDEYRDRLGEYYHIDGNVTVPQIVIDNKRLGGYEDLKKLNSSGELSELLKD